MSFRPIPMLCAGAALALHVTVVSAQPSTHPPGLQPVSPGSFTKATLAAACPSFSWAPRSGAAGYELAVFEFDGPWQLRPEPTLQADLPGAAASWTPSVSECLDPGGNYMWFIREVGVGGGPVGGWSDGMWFSVSRSSRLAAGGEDESQQSDQAWTQDAAGAKLAKPASGGGEKDPPPTNKEILARLDHVLAILTEPEQAFSFELCTEPQFSGEVELAWDVNLKGTVEGRGGAEGFGNGVMARLLGNTSANAEAKVKGGWDAIKLGMCWDLGATVRNRRAARAANPGSVPFRTAAAIDGADLADIVGGLDTAALQEQLQALANRLQLNPARSLEALQGFGDMSFEGGPFAALGENGIFKQLAQSVPLPENVRSLAQDPASLLNTFQELRNQGLCTIDLPPALSGPVAEICALRANEPFQPLLKRVDGAVTTIRTVVQDVQDRLPTSLTDCKFFCGK